jgi:hypothetical protein
MAILYLLDRREGVFGQKLGDNAFVFWTEVLDDHEGDIDSGRVLSRKRLAGFPNLLPKSRWKQNAYICQATFKKFAVVIFIAIFAYCAIRITAFRKIVTNVTSPGAKSPGIAAPVQTRRTRATQKSPPQGTTEAGIRWTGNQAFHLKFSISTVKI